MSKWLKGGCSEPEAGQRPPALEPMDDLCSNCVYRIFSVEQWAEDCFGNFARNVKTSNRN